MDHRQAFSETDSLVGLAVAIGVLEAEDVVARLHAGHGLGIGRRTADIKAALGVPGELGGFGDPERFIGEQIDHEAVRDPEGGLFFGGGHHLLRADVRSGLRGRLGGLLASSQGMDVLIPSRHERSIGLEVLLQRRDGTEALAVILGDAVSVHERPVGRSPAIRPEAVLLDDRWAQLGR